MNMMTLKGRFGWDECTNKLVVAVGETVSDIKSGVKSYSNTIRYDRRVVNHSIVDLNELAHFLDYMVDKNIQDTVCTVHMANNLDSEIKNDVKASRVLFKQLAKYTKGNNITFILSSVVDVRRISGAKTTFMQFPDRFEYNPHGIINDTAAEVYLFA